MRVFVWMTKPSDQSSGRGFDHDTIVVYPHLKGKKLFIILSPGCVYLDT